MLQWVSSSSQFFFGHLPCNWIIVIAPPLPWSQRHRLYPDKGHSSKRYPCKRMILSSIIINFPSGIHSGLLILVSLSSTSFRMYRINELGCLTSKIWWWQVSAIKGGTVLDLFQTSGPNLIHNDAGLCIPLFRVRRRCSPYHPYYFSWRSLFLWILLYVSYDVPFHWASWLFLLFSSAGWTTHVHWLDRSQPPSWHRHRVVLYYPSWVASFQIMASFS